MNFKLEHHHGTSAWNIIKKSANDDAYNNITK